MVNVVLLHAPEDEARARRIAQAWDGGRATLCAMGPHRRRIALGARSVLIGLWSDASEVHESPGENRALQMAGVLSHSAPRALLVVWDGRPPLEAATAAGVPVIVAPEGEGDLMSRLNTAAAELLEGQSVVSDLGDRGRRPARTPTAQGARSWGLALGILIGVLAVLGGLAPFAARLTGEAAQAGEDARN